MRHNKNFNHLGRQSAHRKAMLANMATSLIIHKRISTTVAKAKALKRYAEPIITRSKDDSTHSRRVAFGYLRDKNAVTELFRVVGPAIGDRPGGYTRILKTGFRLGDAADMCIIELVDFNETYTKDDKAAAKGRTRRSRRGGSGVAAKKADTPAKAKAEAAPAVEPAVEAVTEETPQVESTVEETAPVADETTPVAEEAPEATEETKEE
ncbi:MAG: 50S ribosomal protein L17 [Rikenellaceae bacterium]|nr:50S ribosomal protein L17 [Rikenellaceae bacterium]